MMQLPGKFPSTRYQGSKARLVNWIWEHIRMLDFHRCLDAFGGTGAVAYRLKQAGKQVTYNDGLRFNYLVGKALIENTHTYLDTAAIENLLQSDNPALYPDFVQRTFQNIYFTDDENAWIDRTITHINQLTNPYEHALAFFALAQSCIIKRPYNLFHRKNLYLRLADVPRSFGNKISWDKPFPAWFRHFASEANTAIFDNGQANTAMNRDVFSIKGEYDLVYIDPPYISAKGSPTDYRDFYHFLEGLTQYEDWSNQVDYASKHRRLKRTPNIWTDKHRILSGFDRLFERFQESILTVSYRSDGIPSIQQLSDLLQRYKQTVCVEVYGTYQYVLSKNRQSNEVLLIGK